MLEGDYLSVAEMEKRRRWAERMRRWGPLLIPVGLIGTLPMFIEGPVVGGVVVLALVCYGAVNLYFLGRRFERRWDELIAAKRGV